MNATVNKLLNHEATKSTIEVIVNICNYASVTTKYNLTSINSFVPSRKQSCGKIKLRIKLFAYSYINALKIHIRMIYICIFEHVLHLFCARTRLF